MDYLIQKIVSELKIKISDKYEIREMRVFGSSSRGDRRADSDIDVFIYLPHMNRDIEENLFDIAYDLELKYDCLIDLVVFDDDSFREGYFRTPIYQKVLKEGIVI